MVSHGGRIIERTSIDIIVVDRSPSADVAISQKPRQEYSPRDVTQPCGSWARCLKRLRIAVLVFHPFPCSWNAHPPLLPSIVPLFVCPHPGCTSRSQWHHGKAFNLPLPPPLVHHCVGMWRHRRRFSLLASPFPPSFSPSLHRLLVPFSFRLGVFFADIFILFLFFYARHRIWDVPFSSTLLTLNRTIEIVHFFFFEFEFFFSFSVFFLFFYVYRSFVDLYDAFSKILGTFSSGIFIFYSSLRSTKFGTFLLLRC